MHQEMDGVPGQSSKLPNLILTDLKDDLNDPHKNWDRKARALFGTQAPSASKKLAKSASQL